MTKHRTANTVKPYEARDESLLAEGKYREWFYKGMDAAGKAFLRAPVKAAEPPPADNYLINWERKQVRGWAKNSACAGVDPVVFFSESHYPKTEYMKPDAEWRKYCPQCPVREACLQAARDSESVGIWGGKLFVTVSGTSTKTVEYDEQTMPRQGRPRKTKLPMNMSPAERKRAWGEMQKEINDRISAT